MKRNKFILIILVGILILMGVGFAAFSQNLSISETSEVTNNWDIVITNVTTKSGTATNNTEPSYENLTANFDVNFQSMGDYIEYEVTVKNNGNVDAYLNTIEVTNENSETVSMTYSGIETGDVLSSLESITFIVKLSYLGGTGEGSTSIKIGYGSADESETPVLPIGKTVIAYDYQTNGGLSGEITQKYYNEGESVDLNVTGKKEGYTFVGWNTDKDAKTALLQLLAPASDVTLYAIYKKDLKATYKIGKGIYSVEKEEDICTLYNNESSCTLTLPNIEVKEGYEVDGWYDEEGNKKTIGDEITLTKNVTYTAKANDKISPTITLSPNSGNTYKTSRNIEVTISDEDSGLKANQKVYYGWSISNEVEPEYINYVTTNNEEGAKETTVTISSDENITGIYYLWIKEGTLSDVNGNVNKEVISGGFKFDNTLPMLNVTTSKTTRSITVVADAEDDSGISKYEYSIDNGETWIDGGIKNTHTFTDLVYDTYEIKVKVTDGVGLTNETHLGISPNLIETPTFTEDTIGIVTINFPKECEEEYVCSYIKNDETEVMVNTMTQEVVFDSDGTLIAKITDGLNYITSSVYNVIVTIDTEISYSGTSKEYVVPKDGYYKIELYGASSSGSAKGAYTSGEIYLEKGDVLYVYVGQNGSSVRNATSFNGGTSTSDGLAGGGATDVRLVSGEWNNANSLRSRIMVAGGSGASSGLTVGSGGDLIGIKGDSATGGSQTSGGLQDSGFGNGSFGYGGGGCGGGGGYYGGGGALCATGGGGGSSYISGYAGVNSITSSSSTTHTNQTKHYSGKYFINTEMQAGVNSGDGKAEITFIGNPSSEDSKKILGVRYIKDCVNGSSVNVNNHWIEIQAINKGENIAKGKSITNTGTMSTSHGTGTLNTVVDGIMDQAEAWTYISTTGTQCVTVDLGTEYDLEEIAVWHYYGDGRTYYNNVTSVAGENQIYREVYSDEKAETSNGNHIKTYSLIPIFAETVEEEQNTVSIIYPEGCGSTYTCSYIKNEEEEVIVTDSLVSLIFTSNGTITATVKDTSGILANETYKVRRNSLYVASYGSDTEGNGSKENPYASIKTAYANAYDTATIYVMDDVTSTETANFSLDKDIILTSYSEDGAPNSIIRGSELTSHIINQTKGNLKLNNITIDGNNVEAQASLIKIKSTATMNTGTTIKNAVNINDWGGGFQIDGGVVTMNDGEISNNNTTAGGAAVFIHQSGTTSAGTQSEKGTFIMNGGTITGNTSLNGTIWSGGEMVLNGGSIINNTATAYAGGVEIHYEGTLTVNGGTIDNNVDPSWSSPNENIVLASGRIIDTNGNFINDTNNYVMLTALNNNYALDVNNGATTNGTNIQIYQSNKTVAQKWKIIPRKIIDGTIYYSLQNQADGTQYVWVEANSSSSGVNVWTWEMHNSIGGDWTFSNLGNGYYEVKSILGTCMDVSASAANSVNVQTYTCNQTNAQKWKFVDYDSASVAVINSISMSSWVSSEGSYQSCTGKWEDFMFNFDISITGGTVSSGKMCYAANSSSASSYCKNYANSGSTGYGVACFNSATNWVFYRSGHCAYAYATGSHGLSTSRFQC